MDLRCYASEELGIAITGATGYVGNHLLNSFGAHFFKCTPFDEINDESLVIHLAADVSLSRDALINNISMDTYVLETVNKKHRGLIYASGNNIYPFSINCRENEKLRCNDYYSAAKVFGEMIISDMATVPVISLRIADVFGPGQRHGNLFKAIESSLQESKPLKLYGSGLKRRTYIHIDELCAVIKFLSNNFDNTCLSQFNLNIGYSDSANVSEIIETISSQTGLDIEQISIDNDQSSFDVRTMKPSVIGGYQPIWAGFREALTAYIQEVRVKS